MEQAELKTAIRKMIRVELDAMQYYLKAGEALRDEGAIRHFKLLAEEEQEHALSFYQLYPGEDLPPFTELLAAAAEKNSVAAAVDSDLMARLDERQALQLAMKLEKELEENLRKAATQLNAEARVIIEKNAESTLNHYAMIAADYARLYRGTKG